MSGPRKPDDPPLRDKPEPPIHDPPADPTHEPEQPFGDPTPLPGNDPPDPPMKVNMRGNVSMLRTAADQRALAHALPRG